MADVVRISTVLCDLDGVVWLAHQPIAGAPEAIARLRASGRRVVFVTNNSAAVVADHEAALEAIGIPSHGDVLSSALAAATLVQAGERVLVCGGPGVVEAVEMRGATVVPEGPCEAVVVGFHRDFDYERMRVAADAVRAGAKLIGANDDATYPTPNGLIPGAGAILASVTVASGAAAVVAGKPFQPMADLVRDVIGGECFDPATAIVVGDRASTDGLFSTRVGCEFALVRSGVTPPGLTVTPAPAIDATNLAGVVDALTADDPRG
jgi:HAD superfamily hydrolase (TIGR01450 family)